MNLDMENQTFSFTHDIPMIHRTLADGVSQQESMSNTYVQPYLSSDHHHHQQAPYNLGPNAFYPYRRGAEFHDETPAHIQENLNSLAISSIPQMYSSSEAMIPPNYPMSTNLDSFHSGNWDAGKFADFDPHGWIPSENATSFQSYGSSSKFSNELSLTLATSSSDQTSTPTSERDDLSLSYRGSAAAPVLGSSYLVAVQEILAQIANFTLENVDLDGGAGTSAPPCSSNFGGESMTWLVDHSPEQRRRAAESKKAKLLGLLQMVDERYNQCVDEIHTVVAAFHAATELDPRIHARFALKTISVLYNSLRDRISRQCLAMGASAESSTDDIERCFENEYIQKQWALQQLKKKDHQLWRPQRGLPEKSVSVLRAWMFQNFLHPYPKDAEKHLLAIRSGLNRNQVSNWFINARVRLWKPMIEEMYADMNRRKTRRNENSSVNESNQRSVTSTTNIVQRHNM